jgi:hypothetical protein
MAKGRKPPPWKSKPPLTTITVPCPRCGAPNTIRIFNSTLKRSVSCTACNRVFPAKEAMLEEMARQNPELATPHQPYEPEPDIFAAVPDVDLDHLLGLDPKKKRARPKAKAAHAKKPSP